MIDRNIVAETKNLLFLKHKCTYKQLNIKENLIWNYSSISPLNRNVVDYKLEISPWKHALICFREWIWYDLYEHIENILKYNKKYIFPKELIRMKIYT